MGKTIVVCAKYESFDFSVMRNRFGQVPDPPEYGCLGNPFSDKDKNFAVEKFKKYFYERIKKDPLYLKQVMRLYGKKIGCACAGPPCHAYVYADYLNSISTNFNE